MNVSSNSVFALPICQTEVLERFCASHLVEIRVIRGLAVERRWIHPPEFPDLEVALRRLSLDGFNIFAAVNPRSRCESGEAAVAEVVAFHADVDCSAGKTPQEGGLSVPLPSSVVHSGHGWHLYWYLRQPVPVTAGNRARLKAINRGLALATCGDPACCDLSRVLRLPGFINHKPPATPVHIVAAHPVRYTLLELDPFVVDPPATSAAPIKLGEVPSLTVDLKERFDKVRKADRSGETTRAWRGEIGDGSSESRYVLIKRLAESRQFTPEEIVAIAASRRWYNRRSGCEKPPELVLDDAIRVVRKLAR